MKISCQGCRITGNINNTFGGHLNDIFQNACCTSLARRVHTDDIQFDLIVNNFLCVVCGITADEFNICNIVTSGIFFCIDNSRSYDFNTDDLFGMTCQKHRNRTDTAVKIQDRFIATQLIAKQTPCPTRLLKLILLILCFTACNQWILD